MFKKTAQLARDGFPNDDDGDLDDDGQPQGVFDDDDLASVSLDQR